jgi:hypothetical protein
MFDLYASALDNSNDEEQLSDQERSLRQIIDSAMQECSKNNFFRDNFAGKLASSPIANKFLTVWNRKTDEVEQDSGLIHVNDVIAYEKGNESEISLHIRPTGVESTALISKIKDGFEKIAVLLETGKIKADRIIMKSWLFNKKIERKARQLLGDEFLIEDTLPDDSDVVATQHLALQYNKGFLKKYLITGEKPEVRQVVMTKDEFISKFKKV